MSLLILSPIDQSEQKGQMCENAQKIKGGDMISRGNVSLTYAGSDKKTGLLRFNMQDSVTGINETLSLSIKYWGSKVSYNIWSKPYEYF